MEISSLIFSNIIIFHLIHHLIIIIISSITTVIIITTDVMLLLVDFYSLYSKFYDITYLLITVTDVLQCVSGCWMETFPIQ